MKKAAKVKRIPFKQFKKIYSHVPRLCVEVVLKSKKGLLLIRRTIKPAGGQWHTPGGTVLKGERLEETVKRVALEELGARVIVKKFLGVVEYTSYANHYSQDISLAFEVSVEGGKIPKRFVLDGHADKYGFFLEIPANTIKDQKNFYAERLKMKINKTKQ